MTISLKGVEEGTLLSTLALDRPGRRKYEEFLKALEYHKQEEAANAPLSSGRVDELERMFRLLVYNYLQNNGLEIARWPVASREEKIYLRIGDPDRVLFTCEGISLTQPEYSDNFIPELEFLVQPELQVVSYIVRDGRLNLDLLGDCLLVRYLSDPNANGIDVPIVKRGKKKKKLLVASVEQLQTALTDLEQMYAVVGEEGLEQLASVYNRLSQDMPDEQRDETRDKYKLTLLEVMGVKGLLADLDESK